MCLKVIHSLFKNYCFNNNHIIMVSEIEPEIKTFLKRVLQTVTAMVVWAFISMFFGLYLEWAIVHDHFNTFNLIFYTWFLVSLAGLIYVFVRIWKK